MATNKSSRQVQETNHQLETPGGMPVCFHCGEPVAEGTSLHVHIDGMDRSVCCPGCQAVAQAICDYGLENFYKYRTAPSPKPERPGEQADEHLLIYDDPQFQETFVEQQGALRCASLILEGVVCPACTWLIESRLSRIQGVKEISVNYSSSMARVVWDPEAILFSDILNQITGIGYQAWPFHPDKSRSLLDAERKTLLRRIGLAGLLGMQVMMISVALYIGDWSGMDTSYRRFFYWVCLLLTVPVMFYSARDFFVRAWRDLRIFRPGMDVPVALGLGVAFTGSAWATLQGRGHVYYDSVVMFVFLLLLARYLEFSARRQSVRHYDELRRVIPATARCLRMLDGKEQEELVPVINLRQGDHMLVRPGETIPADGRVTAGSTRVDESIITGESTPLAKSTGAAVIGGSTNIDSPVRVTAEKVGRDTVLSGILRLVDSARLGKPRITEFTDRIASGFIFCVIVLAAAVALYWWHRDRAMWLPVTVSVLVITCPCALSLATPVALTSANSALLRQGLAIAGANVMEIMNNATCVVFDKTGTLTEGRPVLNEIRCLSAMGRQRCLEIAAVLEKNSEHPLAAAVREACVIEPAGFAGGIRNYPGLGLCGDIDSERYFLGTAEFIREQTGQIPDDCHNAGDSASLVFLADAREILCVFSFTDGLRAGAEGLIAAVKDLEKRIMLLSGDSGAAVSKVADRLGISDYRSGLQPEQKREVVDDLIEKGDTVVFIGDGVNDAPVLASAHTSIAMGRGVDIAKLNADMILLSNNLDTLTQAFILARKTATIIKQNLTWAVAYNILALPIAASGMVAPWLAAAGMSLSSLVVVTNSIKLGKV